MGLPQKFLFDVSFDQLEVRAEAPKPPPEPTFTQAEVEAARDAGYARGRETAFAEATASTETCTTAALEGLSRGVTRLLEARAEIAAETQRQALVGLQAILRKIAPTLCSKAALTEIEALAVECLHEAIDEPRVVLRVADEVYEPIKSRLELIAAASGYAGRIVLLADNALARSDCRVEWADGGAERNLQRLIGELDAALIRTIDAVALAAPTQAKETEHE
jgi:flagellar assembly protein FliH